MALPPIEEKEPAVVPLMGAAILVREEVDAPSRVILIAC